MLNLPANRLYLYGPRCFRAGLTNSGFISKTGLKPICFWTFWVVLLSNVKHFKCNNKTFGRPSIKFCFLATTLTPLTI